MKEFELIERLIPLLPGNNETVVGPGDDCAVLDVGMPGKFLLFKTDAVVEGVHFTQDDGWVRVGRKAISRALSDIAAMAGEPLSALVTLGLPSDFDFEKVSEIYQGIRERAAMFNVSVSGGETARSTQGIFLSISMVGWVPQGRLLLRKNMRPADALFVTGELGGSRSGKHLDFIPRIEQAKWLADHFEIHALMDVSDGLAGDLQRLIEASGLGLELLSESIPVSKEAKQAARQSGASALSRALSDGEDFELLFTVPASVAVKLLDAWKERFPGLRLSCIGKVVPEKGIRILSRSGRLTKLDCHGYDHFQ
ncbi:MAG: thiamine-phosphate kinase [Verrucomicrobiae bacterium]|nr:thiamine-phosphate kinase [Verrucomicrobiae bacterium]